MSRARDKANSTVSNFASTGIDDNADATAITIDSSENVMVGVTSVQTQTGTTAGTSFYGGSNAGLITAGRNGDILRLNRHSTDGDIAVFRKDGSTVGSIGVTAGDNLYVSSTATDHAGLVFNNTAVGPWVNNAASDGTMDIGTSVNRFRDLYLSGGAYIGGTGSANKLDDYEEGTWSPTYGGSSSNPTVTIDFQHGQYIKIGKIVIASFFVGTDAVSATGSGSLLVNGLPFTSMSGRDFMSGPSLAYSFNQTISNMVMGISGNTTAIILYSNNNSASTFATSALVDGANKNRLNGTVIYEVA